jgi:hypothetical protein
MEDIPVSISDLQARAQSFRSRVRVRNVVLILNSLADIAAGGALHADRAHPQLKTKRAASAAAPWSVNAMAEAEPPRSHRYQYAPSPLGVPQPVGPS